MNTMKSFFFNLVGLTLMLGTFIANAQDKPRKAVFVLVHGAWHGGWCWDKVSEHLSKEGDLVYAPTLSGMSESVLDSTVDLNTHINDIITLILNKDLQNVILVGHSYGGVVITGVADKIPARIKKLVFLDAMLAQNGQSALSLNSKESQNRYRKMAMKNDGGLSVPAPSSAFFGLRDSLIIKSTNARLHSQPLKTFTQPLILKRPFGNNLPLIYIACTKPELEVLDKFAELAKNNKAWNYYELKTGHDAMITMPVELSEMLSSFK